MSVGERGVRRRNNEMNGCIQVCVRSDFFSCLTFNADPGRMVAQSFVTRFQSTQDGESWGAFFFSFYNHLQMKICSLVAH